jgi:hypothetical protein
MTVREALEARLIDWRGRLNRARYERAVAALADRDDALRAVALPIDKATIPDGRAAKMELEFVVHQRGRADGGWRTDGRSLRSAHSSRLTVE